MAETFHEGFTSFYAWRGPSREILRVIFGGGGFSAKARPNHAARLEMFELDEARLQELAKKTQRRVEDQSYFPHLNHEQQQHMKDLWKKFRVQCYDYWMEEVENEKLMHAHGVLKEVVARCTLSFRERSSHVKDAAVCHEEILMAYRHCKRLRTE
ncbi:unnamed protein product [Effrenium voratum]|nr:unnamed protein product [Effrenium voratum]